ASGEHRIVERAEFGDHLRLARAETGFALDVEDHGDAHPAAALDFLVRVEEVALQAPCEQTAHGGLSSAHHADKDQAARGFHGVILRRWKMCRYKAKRPGEPGRSAVLEACVSGRSGARSRFVA